MHKKKIMGLIMTFMVVAMMAGCGEKKQETSTDTQTKSETVVDTKTEEEENSEADRETGENSETDPETTEATVEETIEEDQELTAFTPTGDTVYEGVFGFETVYEDTRNNVRISKAKELRYEWKSYMLDGEECTDNVLIDVYHDNSNTWLRIGSAEDLAKNGDYENFRVEEIRTVTNKEGMEVTVCECIWTYEDGGEGRDTYYYVPRTNGGYVAIFVDRSSCHIEEDILLDLTCSDFLFIE